MMMMMLYNSAVISVDFSGSGRKKPETNVWRVRFLSTPSRRRGRERGEKEVEKREDDRPTETSF